MSSSAVRDALVFRRAIKTYDPAHPISDEDFALLLETARLAPSSNGLEPWHLLVVDDEALRSRLAPLMPGVKSWVGIRLIFFTVKTADHLRPTSDYVQRIVREVRGFDEARVAQFERSFTGMQEERLCLRDDETVERWAMCQAYLALGAMVMAAAFLGVDTCPIEGMRYSEVEAELTRSGLLDPSQDRLAVGLVLGHRDESPIRPQTRRPLDEVVTWS